MLSTGDIIDGKYRIVRLLGEGGMGAVYEGENTRIHRKVAIKVLHSGVAEQGEAVARFEREAQAAGRIGSEHIVEVLDLGTLPGGDRYLVMEYLDGDGLGGRIKARGRLTPSELCPIAHQLMEGLAAAHGAGIIHRDLKPDNVFLLKNRGGMQDFVKLLDFGISKFNQLSGDSGFSMTRTGAVMGTPYYMAPEQAKGSREMDHRVDLYAAGVILYEALTGQVPFNADTFNELLFKIVLEEPRPLEQVEPSIDAGFAAIVAKAMARDPAHRFQTAKEFQEALAQWAAGHGQQLAVQLRVSRAQTGALSASALSRTPAPGGAHPGTLGTGTPGTWAQTGPNLDAGIAPLPKKSNAPLFIGVAVVGLLLGGGGIAAMKMSGDTEAEKKLADVRATEKATQEAATRSQEAKVEEERQRATAAENETTKVKAEAEKAKAEAEKAKALASQAVASAQALAKPPTVAARPAPRPVAAKPAEAAKEAPKAATTTGSGRKIRTSL
jgi:eukaryotic-like serine/threonine-protein kinase